MMVQYHFSLLYTSFKAFKNCLSLEAYTVKTPPQSYAIIQFKKLLNSEYPLNNYLIYFLFR